VIHRTAIVYAAVFAAVWAIASAWRPGSTYHLAPVLVAAAVPTFTALERRSSASPGHMMRDGLTGVAIALVAALVLSAAGRLQGPSLLPFGGPAAEAVVGAVAGGLIGVLGAATLARSSIAT
jgi:hypothetical protein